jgi:hypothetical protein
MVWHAVPLDEFPAKGKSIYQTALKPVVLDIISDSDIEDMKKPLSHRELRIKRVERWTQQAFDQGALLSQLDLAVLLSVNEYTAGNYVREYQSLYGRTLPTRVTFSRLAQDRLTRKKLSLFIRRAILSLQFVKELITLRMLLNVTSVTLKLLDFFQKSLMT